MQRVTVLLATISVAGMVVATPACAQWSLDVKVGLHHDSNLNNVSPGSIRGDSALTTAIVATRSEYLDSGDALSWGAKAETESYARYAGMNNLLLGGLVGFRHKLGFGPFAPWLSAGWSSSHLSYVNGIRDGWLHQADFGAGQRFDERWSLTADYRLEKRSAKTQPESEPNVSGDAYSGYSTAFLLSTDYVASPDILLSVNGFVRRGDVVSISVDNDQVLDVSKAAADDFVFGPGQYSYRLFGNSYGLGLGVGLSLGQGSRLDFGLQRQITHGDGGNNYAKNINSMTWARSF